MVLTGAAGIKPKRSIRYYISVYSYKLGKIILKPFKGLSDRFRKNAGSSDYQNASDVMKGILIQAVNFDITPYLKDIETETLLVFGDKDDSTPLYMGKIMEEKLKALWKQFPERISYVSGIGMAWAVTFAEADTHAIHPEFALEVTKKCNENGLTFFAAVGAGITMKLTPPLTIPDDALIEGLEAYATAVAEADAIMPAYK